MNDRAKDTDIPNRASNMEKAEGDRVENANETRTEEDRWTSDSDTIERQDRDRLEAGTDAEQSGPGTRSER